MSTFQSSSPDDLLHIYSTLRRLNCIQRGITGQPAVGRVNAAIFPTRFLLKILDERLEELDEFAREICDDLFKQIGGKPKKVDLNHLNQLDKSSTQTNEEVEHEFIRYPEFDNYFHCCIYYLYDFIIELRWHEVDIDILTKSDANYVAKSLEYTNQFLKFKESLVDQAISNDTPSKTSPEKLSGRSSATNQAQKATSPRSNLAASNKSPAGGKRRSPIQRRRVRFESATLKDEDNRIVDEPKRKPSDQYFKEVHSDLALDLLIHALDVFVKQLLHHFQSWSSSVGSKLEVILNEIFGSRQKMRASQLQLIAKRVKIYMDVHLTVLDYLNEIKATYLIDKTLEVICARDSIRLVEGLKRPKIMLYVQRCMDIERLILTGMLKQCLQIFLSLLVNEINFPPVELGPSMPQKNLEDANKSHENIISFVAGWLRVEDIIFGYARPKQSKGQQQQRVSVEKVANQIQRPNIVANSSTLSLDAYASSSRILAQMDNLCEFLKSFTSMTSDRLRHEQQTRFFFESLATGMFEFFEMVSRKLAQQLTSQSVTQVTTAVKSAPPELVEQSHKFSDNINLDSMAAKIRCLKFIHIMTLAENHIRAEAKQVLVDVRVLDKLKMSIDRFTSICFDVTAKKDMQSMTSKSPG